MITLQRKKKKKMDRIKQNAEVFTPPQLVKEMLDKLPKEVWKEDKTFLDNSCGDGNFLVAVLARKLKYRHNHISALRTIYGTDIMKDNIQKCRRRLLEVLASNGVIITKDHCLVVMQNIKWLSRKEYPKGSLGYDFSFDSRITKKQIDILYNSYYRHKKELQ